MGYANVVAYRSRQPVYITDSMPANGIQKLVVDGDSIAFADYGIYWLYRRVAAGQNLAVPGNTIAQVRARASTFRAAIATNAVGLIWCGTNTIAGEPDTVAGGNDAADQLFSMIDDEYRVGGSGGGTWGNSTSKLYIVNIAKRGDSPVGYPQVAWAQFHARLAAEAHLHSSGPAILTSDMPGTPGDQRNYDVDKMHILRNGYTWLYRNRFAPLLDSIRF